MEFEAIGFEELKTFLTDLGITVENEQPEVGFNRMLICQTPDVVFKIEWYRNQSTVYSADGSFSYPFKYIYKDISFPQRGKWIGFSSLKNKRESIFDREYPYEILRIRYENLDT